MSSLLLAGCVGAPPEENAESTTAASEPASPSPSPTPEETTPEETATKEPEETEEPVETPEPSVEPTETPAPTLEPLPAGPDDPFVPPPHGEPAPGPFVPPPHGEPNPGAPSSNVVTPSPEWGAVGITVRAGTSFTITGGGYQPGQRIQVFFGPANTDYSIIGDQSAYASLSGDYSLTITLSPGIAPGSYGVMTATPDGLATGPEIDATRRWASVEVVAP